MRKRKPRSYFDRRFGTTSTIDTTSLLPFPPRKKKKKKITNTWKWGCPYKEKEPEKLFRSLFRNHGDDRDNSSPSFLEGEKTKTHEHLEVVTTSSSFQLVVEAVFRKLDYQVEVVHRLTVEGK
jgi:hypothetical protein